MSKIKAETHSENMVKTQFQKSSQTKVLRKKNQTTIMKIKLKYNVNDKVD